MDSSQLLLVLLGVVAVIYLLYLKKKNDKKQKFIDSLGEKTYNELKHNFDARRIMGEMNYLIDEITEYSEQSEYFRSSHRKASNSTAVSRTVHSFLNAGEANKIKQESELFKITKKTLDDYIKKEWNPRIKILTESSNSYYSDKELRDAYTQFMNANTAIQKMTIEGENQEKSLRDLKVAGIALVAVTGLALGAMGAANRSVDRQNFRDHFGA
jgi:hypothetical protein